MKEKLLNYVIRNKHALIATVLLLVACVIFVFAPKAQNKDLYITIAISCAISGILNIVDHLSKSKDIIGWVEVNIKHFTPKSLMEIITLAINHQVEKWAEKQVNKPSLKIAEKYAESMTKMLDWAITNNTTLFLDSHNYILDFYSKEDIIEVNVIENFEFFDKCRLSENMLIIMAENITKSSGRKIISLKVKKEDESIQQFNAIEELRQKLLNDNILSLEVTYKDTYNGNDEEGYVFKLAFNSLKLQIQANNNILNKRMVSLINCAFYNIVDVIRQSAGKESFIGTENNCRIYMDDNSFVCRLNNQSKVLTAKDGIVIKFLDKAN